MGDSRWNGIFELCEGKLRLESPSVVKYRLLNIGSSSSKFKPLFNSVVKGFLSKWENA